MCLSLIVSEFKSLSLFQNTNLALFTVCLSITVSEYKSIIVSECKSFSHCFRMQISHWCKSLTVPEDKVLIVSEWKSHCFIVQTCHHSEWRSPSPTVSEYRSLTVLNVSYSHCFRIQLQMSVIVSKCKSVSVWECKSVIVSEYRSLSFRIQISHCLEYYISESFSLFQNANFSHCFGM